jgi:glycosyltransferase involved in cell wall biosynthesis
MTPPRISIITPSLNQGRYLERTIRSVINQGYPELEYIVVDGGSTDDSVAILERYSEWITRWVSEKDQGQAHAINKGLGWATGEIVAYINSDDYYLAGALEAAAKAMGDGTRWCAGRCRYVNTDGSLHAVLDPDPPRMPRRTMIRETWYAPQASSFWRSDVFRDVGPLRDDLQYVFDLEFGLRCALSGVVPRRIDQEIAVRYLHGEAKSANPDRFAAEYRGVRRELEEAYLGPFAAVPDVAYRARRRLLRVAGRR